MTPTPSITRPPASTGILGCGAALLILLPCPGAADPSAPAPPSLVDSLTQNDLQQAFRALLEKGLAADKLSDLAINRAALAGLLGILGPGAELLPPAPSGTPEPASPQTNLIASLPGSIVYVRPAVLDETLFQELRDLPVAEAGLILDLRCPGGGLDAALASRLASHFCSPGSLHFTLVDSKNAEIERHTQDPGILRRPGTIAVLVDSRSSPGGETVAAVLRFHERKRCLILGERTLGRAAVYETLDLGGRARLTHATAGVRLPDGTPLFGSGVVPDIPVAPDPEARAALLGLSDPADLAAYLAEPERPVLNEAALMAGTNPALPELLREPPPGVPVDPSKPQPDRALRQAIDFLATRDFLEHSPDEQVD